MRNRVAGLFGGLRRRGTGASQNRASGRRRAASPSGGRSSGT
ncbi:hypothetical protein [Actinoallomurus sp. NPDC052274]